MRQFHDRSGHWQTEKTSKMVSKMIWWPTMQRDVKKCVILCHECQVYIGKKNQVSHRSQLVYRIFHTLLMDVAGPLPLTSSGKGFLLLAVEHLTG